MAVRVQKIGPEGQVTLPKHVRDALGLKTGELVETILTTEGALNAARRAPAEENRPQEAA